MYPQKGTNLQSKPLSQTNTSTLLTEPKRIIYIDVFRNYTRNHAGILIPQLWVGAPAMHRDLSDPDVSTMNRGHAPVTQPCLLPKLIPVQVNIIPP